MNKGLPGKFIWDTPPNSEGAVVEDPRKVRHKLQDLNNIFSFL